MKKYFLLFASFFIVFEIGLMAPSSLNATSPANFQNKKMIFWESQKKGANIFNKNIPLETIIAAKNYGVQFIRLTPDKFPSKKRDFLLGSADHYQGLVPQDLKMLKNTLDLFHREGIPVVLTMLSLPGYRWIQHNNNSHDLRLWTEQKFQDQAVKFWQDLARALKDHPAIVGYNIVNEPHPERIYGQQGSIEREKNTIQANTKLHDFYSAIIKGIREVDSKTPIILDSSNHADAEKFSLLIPFNDPFVLYSFHFYEPYTYTNLKLNEGKWHYPGNIPDDDDAKTLRFWDKSKIKEYLQPVINFQKHYKIPSYKILVGEFGGHRSTKGLEKYFGDLLSIFNEQKWHFAIYAFREDTWDGMDYELGTKKLSWNYWKAIEEGKEPILHRSSENPTFLILKSEWQH